MDLEAVNRTLRRSNRIAKKPVVSHAEFSVEGASILLNVLELDKEVGIDLSTDNYEEKLAKILSILVRSECEYDARVFGSLTEPIDDVDAKDPKTIREAQASIYWAEWLAALYEELEALRAKGVYEDVEELPPGRKAIGSKWVLHIKRNKDGMISRFKARLVAKGFSQIPGQDFTYTFAPVARWDSIRTLLTLAATFDYELRHIDVKTAFLNGPLEEELYMRKPEILGSGYWRLLRGLYGLKQAGRQWYHELNATLEKLGFRRTESDWSVHTRSDTTTNGKSFSATSVDDMLLASSSKDESDFVTNGLKAVYEITDYGDVDWLLGCKITRWRDRRCIKVDQEVYTLSILREYNFDKGGSAPTPMPPKVHLTTDMCPTNDKEREEMSQHPYAAVVGKLMYLATCTRPDIAYAVRELARFMGNPGRQHWVSAKHVLRYLRGTSSYGIYLGNKDSPYPLFKGLSDSDWAQGEERKSITGYVIMLGESPISWSSKQQTVVALSSCEAEYLACSHCACQILWLRNLFEELGYPQQTATPLFCDNQGTVACTHDPHGHTRMKQIDMRAHMIRNCVNKRLIDVIYLSNKSQVADIFTKALGKILHRQWVEHLRLDAGQGGVLSNDHLSSGGIE